MVGRLTRAVLDGEPSCPTLEHGRRAPERLGARDRSAATGQRPDRGAGAATAAGQGVGGG